MKKITNITYATFAVFTLVCFPVSPKVQAVSPPPDGGYPGGNTSEGQNALLSLITGTYNTAIGVFSLESNTVGNFNTATGAGTLLSNIADDNTAIGAGALFSNNVGTRNTASGAFALFSNTLGSRNTAMGPFAMQRNTTGNDNIAMGYNAGTGLTTGSNNIAVGTDAGIALTTGNDNIDIGNIGDAENSAIRIGTTGTQTATYIAGIRDITTGNADAIPVVIDSTSQLGTVSSSRRFKNEIKPMNASSEAILALKPVTFHYKSDQTGTLQFGLIAEEVAKVSRDLIVRDKTGEIYTVRYDAVNAMLLNEFLKEHRKNEEQQATIAQLKAGMEALTATVKEQAAQIQKVSAQLEASGSAPQVADSNY